MALVEASVEAKLHAELYASFPEDAGRSASASDAVREAARDTPYDEETGEGGDHKLTYGEGERVGSEGASHVERYRPELYPRAEYPSRRATCTLHAHPPRSPSSTTHLRPSRSRQVMHSTFVISILERIAWHGGLGPEAKVRSKCLKLLRI